MTKLYTLDENKNVISLVESLSSLNVSEDSYLLMIRNDELYKTSVKGVEDLFDKKFMINFSIDDLGEKESSITLSKTVEGAWVYFTSLSADFSRVIIKLNGTLLNYSDDISTGNDKVFMSISDNGLINININHHLFKLFVLSINNNDNVTINTLFGMGQNLTEESLPRLFEFNYRY